MNLKNLEWFVVATELLNMTDYHLQRIMLLTNNFVIEPLRKADSRDCVNKFSDRTTDRELGFMIGMAD